MLVNYWFEQAGGETPPWVQVTNYGSVIYYSTQPLDTDVEKDMAVAAMQLWQDVANVTFSYVPDPMLATLVFEDDEVYDHPSAETVSSGLGSVVNISSSWITEYGAGPGSYSFTSYVHEIGHALGLGHPGPYDEDQENPGAVDYYDNAMFANDTWHDSIMSYFSQSNELGAGNDYALPMTPQMADIWALQFIYGPATTTRTGDTTYGFNSTAGPVFDFSSYNTAGTLPVALTIYDSGGTDTLDCSGFSQDQTIILWAGTYSDIGGLHGNVGIWGVGGATDTIIENAIGGSGYDKIYGNAAGNELSGGGGSDVLDGSGGEDQLYGESGEDTLNGGADDDKLYGGDDNDILHSGEGDDLLVGDDGDDFLHGGAGGDLMLGGGGVDTASYFDAPAPGVTVNLNQPGANTGDAAGDTYLSVENVEGSDFDDILIGDDDDNMLWGGKYDDELHGGDGNDYDQLFGEAGADTLFASEGSDYLDGGDGFDQVVYSGNVVVDLADFTMNDWTAKGDRLVSIEKVIADNKDDDQLFGDDQDNWLHGTGGNDLLNGRGGADILDGGNDNDTVTYVDASMKVTADLSRAQAAGGQGKRTSTSSLASRTSSDRSTTMSSPAMQTPTPSMAVMAMAMTSFQVAEIPTFSLAAMARIRWTAVPATIRWTAACLAIRSREVPVLIPPPTPTRRRASSQTSQTHRQTPERRQETATNRSRISPARTMTTSSPATAASTSSTAGTSMTFSSASVAQTRSMAAMESIRHLMPILSRGSPSILPPESGVVAPPRATCS